MDPLPVSSGTVRQESKETVSPLFLVILPKKRITELQI